MTSTTQPLSSIKLRGHRKRRFAGAILKRHLINRSSLSSFPLSFIKVVCVSDTHNTRPLLPHGDVLIHAGDLTENGSFDEVQAELTWLSSQPHRYKVLIAGNHDVLFDETFLAKYPGRRYGSTKTKIDLDWGSVIYLQDSCVTLEFPSREAVPANSNSTTKNSHYDSKDRTLVVFGSPWTPQYGISAFQYRPDNHHHWANRLSTLNPKPDIIITHGPPRGHLDRRDFHQTGCAYLAEEIAQLRPRLVVFGHIHAAYGREDVVLDGVQRAYEEVMTGWAGWEGVLWMVVLVLWDRAKWMCGTRRGKEKVTTFVNAAVVGGSRNELKNTPVVVEL